jgi:outer membrane lipoprotein-sorting protein
MKKLIHIIIASITVILLLSGFSCASKPLSPELEELLNKIDDINEIKYTVVASYSNTDETITMNVWMKEPDIRLDVETGGSLTVFLADMEKKTGYTYMPAGNIATRTDFEDIPSSIKADIDEIRKYKPTITGAETIDGKSCTVVTYSYGSTNGKAWIWNDYGLFIRQELTKGNDKILIEINGIDFSEIPDSVFELPDDVMRSDWMDETPAN